MAFDNQETRADKQVMDKFATFKDIWTKFVAQLSSLPGTNFCVEETLD